MLSYYKKTKEKRENTQKLKESYETCKELCLSLLKHDQQIDRQYNVQNRSTYIISIFSCLSSIASEKITFPP